LADDTRKNSLDWLRSPLASVSPVKSLSHGETGVLVYYQENGATRTALADIVGRVKPIDTELFELADVLTK
jgi:hypothetical protein